MAKKKVIEPKIEEVKANQTFQVFDSRGDFVRDYKTEISGDNCEEMAKELAQSIGGTVK